MSIFKKKKPIGEVILEPPKDFFPKVIKEAKIKPTTCKYCKSIYQANRLHLRTEKDMGYINPKYTLFAICPICHNYNVVEFEGAEE